MVLRREIDQFLARRAQVAAPFVDPAFEPLSCVKCIGGGVPPDDLRPVRRTTPKNDSNGRVTREDDRETALPSRSRFWVFACVLDHCCSRSHWDRPLGPRTAALLSGGLTKQLANLPKTVLGGGVVGDTT